MNKLYNVLSKLIPSTLKKYFKNNTLELFSLLLSIAFEYHSSYNIHSTLLNKYMILHDFFFFAAFWKFFTESIKTFMYSVLSDALNLYGQSVGKQNRRKMYDSNII